MTDTPIPSESERRAFVVKLAEFRSTLCAAQQRMLDALVGAAVVGRGPEEIVAYWISPRHHPTDASVEREPSAN